MSSDTLHALRHGIPLAPGTRVGAWRVKAYQGQGAYGAVYQAERVGWRRSEPGALKVSLLLWNARVEREVKLLSRLSHPSIPRLLDRGGSLPPSSHEYPYFVMEWVQGPELYAWVEKHAPSGARAGEEEGIESARPPVRTRAWKPWLAVAAVGVCAVWLWCSQWVPRLPGFSNAQAPAAGSVAVGDSSPVEPEVATPPSEESKPIAQEPIPEPRPEQARPNKKGRCPGRKQVSMNGGCWEQIPRSIEECAESGYVHIKGECYLPAPAPPKKPMPTASPEQAR